MRNGYGLFLSATFASLLFTGKPSAAGSERGAVSPSFAVELSSPAGGEFLLRHLESDLYGGPSSFSVPGGEAFLSWLTGGGAVLSAAPTGLDGPPTVLLGIVCNESVTGGGTIPVGTSKGSFGFSAGIKDGFIFVGMEYVDHDIDMHLKMLSITAYAPGASGDCRHFEGDAAIDGVAGFTYSVDVCDNGEPGVGTDTFSISLSTGYSASGTITGGNIQYHEDCP